VPEPTTVPSNRSWAEARLPLALVAAAMLLPLGVLFSGTMRGDHSSRSGGPDGSAALFAVLERLDLPVEQLGVGLLPLRFEDPGSVLFMPLVSGGRGSGTLTDGETDMLVRFVENGSSLVLLSDTEADALSAFELEIETRGRGVGHLPSGEPTEAQPVFLSPDSLAGSLGVEGEAWLLPGPEDAILFGSEAYPVVLQRDVGAGRVLLVSDPSTLSNRGLGRGANLEFYVAFTRRWLGPGGRVLFDDLHAGASSERGIVAYARKAGLLPMLLLICLLLILYLWRASVRFGAASSSSAASAGRAETERIRATAGLYERAGLYRYGLSLSSQRLRRHLNSRSGLTWGSESLSPWVERQWGDDAALRFDYIEASLATLLSQESPDPRACRAAASAIYSFEENYLQGRVDRDRNA
jgi:hypothetical protein